MTTPTHTPELLRKYAAALPFADNERGHPETAEALRWAAEEIAALRAENERLRAIKGPYGTPGSIASQAHGWEEVFDVLDENGPGWRRGLPSGIAAVKAIRDMRAVVGTLHKTADGMPVTDGMTLFYEDDHRVGTFKAMYFRMDNGPSFRRCYSTRAACEAAINDKGGGECL